jgi:hypothetical protein
MTERQPTKKFSATGRADGAGTPGRARLGMGLDRLDRGHDRVHGGDTAVVGVPGAARRGPAPRCTEERERIRALERENRELRQANEILRKASAYFAQAELDRPFKR